MSKYREKKITSIKELKKVIEVLESDEGLRIIGSLKDFSGGGFIFVTRSSGGYCVNICEMVHDSDYDALVPGGKEEWFYPSTMDDVWRLIETKIKKPLKAWLY